jgi:hypothetical protein
MTPQSASVVAGHDVDSDPPGSIRAERANIEAAKSGQPAIGSQDSLEKDDRVASIHENINADTRYTVSRHYFDSAAAFQKWSVELRNKSDEILFKSALPDTAKVYWRYKQNGGDFVTSSWVRACASRVWVIQDGYQMIATSLDQSLTQNTSKGYELTGAAEVSSISNVHCLSTGVLQVSGYVFGVSGVEPVLDLASSSAKSFLLNIGRNGELLRQQLAPAEFSIRDFCAVPVSEQKMFCDQANAVIGR